MFEHPSAPFCQSCGMPLYRDPRGGGTNADGSKSMEYCSHCYQNGQFTQPTVTLTQMQAGVRGRLQEQGVPAARAEQFVSDIAHLKRWQA